MIVLITGPEGAGKTTTAGVLARRFERAVHIDGDVFRQFVVAGRAEMTPAADDEALAQLRLRYRLTLDAARAYAAAGFDVVVSDVVGGPLLEEVAASYERVVVLLPEERVVRSRRGERHTSWIYRLFADETPRIGVWLDNGDLTPEQTAAAILRR